MSATETIREGLLAAKVALTNHLYDKPRIGMEDAHAKVCAALEVVEQVDVALDAAADAIGSAADAINANALALVLARRQGQCP